MLMVMVHHVGYLQLLLVVLLLLLLVSWVCVWLLVGGLVLMGVMV